MYRSRNSRESGATLVLAIFLVSAVTMLSFAMASMINSTQREQRGSREELDTLYICEAGVAAAVADLQAGGDGILGTEQNPMVFGAASYHVTSTALGNGLTSILASGRASREENDVRVIVREHAGGYFDWAAFGDEGVSMDGNAMIDSYDSSTPYATQEVNGSGADTYAGDEGNIGANADITIATNTYVHGDASPGETGTITITGTAGVSGSTEPVDGQIEMPPITIPVLAAAPDVSVPVNTTQTIGPGGFDCDNFAVGNNGKLVIIGPMTIVTTNFLIEAGAEIVVDATNGPVEFFVEQDFLVKNNTLIASTDFEPADVRFNLLSDNVIDPDEVVDLDDVTLESGSQIHGVIYAPSAYVEIDSNFQLFGALAARSVHLDSNSEVHYDTALRTALRGQGSSVTYQTICYLVGEPAILAGE